jgi:hypothetical protein
MLYKLGYGATPPFFTFLSQTKITFKNPTGPSHYLFVFFVFALQFRFTSHTSQQFSPTFQALPPSPSLSYLVVSSCHVNMSMSVCHVIMSVSCCHVIMSYHILQTKYDQQWIILIYKQLNI